MEDSTPYRMPEDFNPFISIDAARGLTDAIHHFLLEGPGTQRVIPFGDKAGADALVELLQAEVHALHDYLHEITNRTSLNLPMSDAEFDALDIQHRQDGCVKEPRARYG
ncbi:MAG TPA: hypothetical protein VF275_12085 [Gammaproteobacteria bacterium]